MKRFAFYGRVSTEDQQDPQSSRNWQLARSRQVIEPAGGEIVEEFFDIGQSRSLPWKRRPEAARLLDTFRNPRRGFDAVVIGEPQRAFYGNQFGLTFPVFVHYGIGLWVPEVTGLDARRDAAALEIERRLPNKVTFGARVVPGRDGARMELWIGNGSAEKLTGLHAQMCVMLKGLPGFEERTNDNKVFAKPFVACRDRTGKRWVITAWEPCVRAWGNPPCPCLHSDPQVPDCPPGETTRARGWLSFFEGDDIDAEIRRLRAVAFGPAKEKP